MSNYLIRYKGKYRILPELDLSTNDFPRNPDGSIEDNDIYIACSYNNRIYTYGHTTSAKVVWLLAYIPSIGRARNIKKALDENGITYEDYRESDIEAEFRFLAKDIEEVATLMKAKTSGASISPFSSKNLPRSIVEIPTEEIARYKEISSKVDKADLLIIHRITTEFLDTVLQKKYKKIKGKDFNYKTDIKKRCMARQVKEYIWTLDMWEEYLKYLDKEIDKFYSNK